jgi:uncharacterized protein
LNAQRLDLLILDVGLAVCRLDPIAEIPAWVLRGEFFSITRTADELSVVCPEAVVPSGVRSEKGWRAIRVSGTIDFTVVGVLAGLAEPLAVAGISLFAVSTFDTDYLLVKVQDLDRAIEVLQASGHAFPGLPPRGANQSPMVVAD